MDNFIGPLAGAMAKYPALGTIVALFLVLGGALGLLAGPLMALGQIGPAIQEVKAFGKAIWNLPGTIKNGIGWLQDKFSSLGSSAEDSATKQELLSASQDASGNLSCARIDQEQQPRQVHLLNRIRKCGWSWRRSWKALKKAQDSWRMKLVL